MEQAGIIIVEDEEIIAFDLRNRLTRLGYRILGTFSRGEPALQSAQEVSPDLVLMDIMLEGEMDGVQTAARFSELQIPVVFVTASSDDETFERAKHTRPFGYIIKPFDENLLRITIEIALYKTRMEREIRRNEERIKKINSCFLAFGPDPDRNVEALVDVTVDLFQADGVWYGCRLSGNPGTVVLRGLPDGFHPGPGVADPLLGPRLVPPHLLGSELTGLGIRTAFAHGIQHAGEGIGFFLLFFKRIIDIDEHDKRLLGILAAALGIEEERKLAEERSRKLQLQLIQSQKLEAIGVMAGGVAHEINNPLMGIINYAQLMLDRLAPDAEKMHGYCREIIHEGERIAGIVRNLLAFSRQERLVSELAQPAAMLETILLLTRRFLQKDEISLELDVPPDLPPVFCRRQQIEQVLLNLINNARDALNERFPGFHDQKKLVIAVESVPGMDGEPGRIRFLVRDHGGGIPETIRSQVFDPFFSTKPKHLGTGLGLSVSYGIIGEHGGSLTFETETGKGTQFLLELPLSQGR